MEGTKSYFTISAEKFLNDEVKRFQLQGWDFNSEDNYPLIPNIDDEIIIPENLIMINLPSCYKNRYVVRDGKLYDKRNHTFKIEHTLKASVVFCFDFDELPEVAKEYAKMSAAYKFVKRELGSEKACVYTQEDLSEARIALEQHELEIGDYTMIPDMYNGNIRSSI